MGLPLPVPVEVKWAELEWKGKLRGGDSLVQGMAPVPKQGEHA